MSTRATFDSWLLNFNDKIVSNLKNCPAAKTCINYTKGSNIDIKYCFCGWCGIYQQVRSEPDCTTNTVLDTIINDFSKFTDEEKKTLLPEWRKDMSELEFKELVIKELMPKCNISQTALNYINNTNIIIEKCGSPSRYCDICGIYQYCDLKSQCIYYAAINLVREKIFPINTLPSNNKNVIIVASVIVGTLLLVGGGILLYVIRARKRKQK